MLRIIIFQVFYGYFVISSTVKFKMHQISKMALKITNENLL